MDELVEDVASQALEAPVDAGQPRGGEQKGFAARFRFLVDQGQQLRRVAGLPHMSEQRFQRFHHVGIAQVPGVP